MSELSNFVRLGKYIITSKKKKRREERRERRERRD
jgi:hypothetical protein